MLMIINGILVSVSMEDYLKFNPDPKPTEQVIATPPECPKCKKPTEPGQTECACGLCWDYTGTVKPIDPSEMAAVNQCAGIRFNELGVNEWNKLQEDYAKLWTDTPEDATLRSPESELILIDGTGFASGKTNHFFASLGALSDEERKGVEFTLSTTGHCKNCHCQTPHDQDICDDCINPEKPI